MEELELVLDHVTLSVADLPRATEFYQRLLAPIGLSLIAELTAEQTKTVAFSGFGIGRKGSLWIAGKGRQTPPCHVCFRTHSRENVRTFHAAGLAAGGQDNGAPGVRLEYHPAYYAAFILSPEGHNIEAVCFEPES